MNIVSLAFAAFTVITTAVYYLRQSGKSQNYILLGASLLFYLSWNVYFPAVLLGVAAFNYYYGRMLRPALKPPRNRLWLGIGFNVLVLAFFVAMDFFRPEAGTLRILMPIGLSFYSLQCISYLVDVSRRQVSAERPFVDFVLYLVYFPKLTAGPIERPLPFLDQLARPRQFGQVNFGRSLSLIVVGLVRKVIVADVLLGAVPARIFESPATFPGLALIFSLGVWVFGLYNDFAGYTNIVRGVSGLFGIELSRNFAHPFFARNFNEFWNRWHISLSHWLRDYIFFPINRMMVRRTLGRSRLTALVVPALLTMLASGLWHGTGWHFLYWGGLMGLFLVIEQLPSLRGPVIPPDQRPVWQRLLRMGLVSAVFTLSGVFFLMDVPTALVYVRNIFNGEGWGLNNLRIGLLILGALALDVAQYRSGNELFFLRWPVIFKAAFLALALAGIFYFSQVSPVIPFIYQGF